MVHPRCLETTQDQGSSFFSVAFNLSFHWNKFCLITLKALLGLDRAPFFSRWLQVHVRKWSCSGSEAISWWKREKRRYKVIWFWCLRKWSKDIVTISISKIQGKQPPEQRGSCCQWTMCNYRMEGCDARAQLTQGRSRSFKRRNLWVPTSLQTSNDSYLSIIF